MSDKKKSILDLVPAGQLTTPNLQKNGQTLIQAVTDDIPPDFEGMCARIQALTEIGRSSMLLCSWGIGRLVLAIQENHGKSYGSEAVPRMAVATGLSERLVFDMLRLYQAYPEATAVQSLGLEWSATREVLKLEGPVRDRVVKEAVTGNLTVREVRARVTEERKKTTPAPPKQPARRVQARAYFGQVNKLVASQVEALQDKMHKKPDMLHITSDDKQTSDEDYSAIVDGDADTVALVEQIASSAERLIAYLQREVVTLRYAFKEDDT